MNRHRTCCLIETYDPAYDYSGQVVIPLTPQAAYQLGLAKIPYRLLEEFYSEQELIRHRDAYFLEQLEWIHRLDDLFKEAVALCRERQIAAAHPHYSPLKFCLDGIAIWSFRMKKLWGQGWDRVTYVGHVPQHLEGGDHSLYNFKEKVPAVVTEIMPRFAKAPGQFVIHETRSGSSEAIRPLPKEQAVERVLKRLGAKQVYHAWKYHKLRSLAHPDSRFANLRVLSLDAGTPSMDQILQGLIERGATVYLRQANQILELSQWQERPVCELNSGRNSSTLARLRAECAHTWQELNARADLVSWIDHWLDGPISEVIRPYLKHFVEELVPSYLLEAHQLLEWLSRAKISCVIARASSGRLYPAPLEAAKQLGIPRACFAHSSAVLDLNDWTVDELDFFDAYFATDGVCEAYFRDRAQLEYLNRCQVFQAPHYLKGYAGRRSHSKRKGRRILLYVPKKFPGALTKLNTYVDPMAWYVEFQKRVLDFLASRRDAEVIYKHSPFQAWAEGSVIPYIKDRHPQIRVAQGPLADYLSQADRVLLDYPSTALFEAAAAGVPAMSLCREVFKRWEPSVAAFGHSVQPFSTVEEALEKVRLFLDSDPAEYVVHLPFQDDQPLERLLEFGDHGCHADRRTEDLIAT